MSSLNKGLGKGLGALLSVQGIPEQEKDSVVELKMNDISPNSEQPRKHFNEDLLNELSDSIKENGVIQPIIVTKRGTGYRIVAGERRWRASRLAGLSVIPAIVRELSDLQTMEQALIENIQREDLNPLEEAFAMDNLMREHGLTQEQLSKKLGKSRSAVANTIRLMNIDESLQDFIYNGDLTAGHARALLALPTGEMQRIAADFVLSKELSVRETEAYVTRLLTAKPIEQKTKEPISKDAEAIILSAKDCEKRLTKRLGTKVRLKLKDQIKGKGSVVIDYYSYDDLQRVLEIIER